jgi:predicted dehydrogenase
MNPLIGRRQFLQRSASVLALAAAGVGNAAVDLKPVRIGIVGVGHRGSYLAELLAGMPGVEVTALCDINPQALERSIAKVKELSGKIPRGYGPGPKDYLRLVDQPDLDAVIAATPWDSLASICIAAMKAGKYAGIETGPAMSVEECWELVETSEKTKMPCMMLENVCFFRNVMMALNMVRKGALGEMTHCAGGYQHDLRLDYLDRHTLQPTWLGEFHVRHNANLYPVHAIGPISQWLKITRGDQFDYLASMSSKSAGMSDLIARRSGAEGLQQTSSFKNGDVNVTLLRTRNGATVTLYYDTQSPRAYDLGLRAQGTRGICMVADGKVFLEGRSKKVDEWESLDRYTAEFEHPVWQRANARTKTSGHGGSDYFTLEAFVESVRMRRQPLIDVYDTATWRVISSLSEKSTAHRSRVVDFPDFTKGKWKTRSAVSL